jgi:hypothetical protein
MNTYYTARPVAAAGATVGFIAKVLAGLAIAFVTTDVATARAGDDDTYAIGLWGDLPYESATSTVQTAIGVPNLIADMNAQRLQFTVHD